MQGPLLVGIGMTLLGKARMEVKKRHGSQSTFVLHLGPVRSTFVLHENDGWVM
jgi:hypothetical protein